MMFVSLTKGERTVAHHLDEIKAEVTRLKTVKSANKALLTRLAAKIEELKNDPVELAALAADLRADVDEINNDVVANTPAESQPA